MMEFTFGLCAKRHVIKDVDDYIFDKNFFAQSGSMFNWERNWKQICHKLSAIKSNDTLHLYVTGLTSALTSVIDFCAFYHIDLKLYHYDTDTQTYIQQIVRTGKDRDLLIEGGYGGYCLIY